MRYLSVVLAFFALVGVAFVISSVTNTGTTGRTVGYIYPPVMEIPTPGRTLYREPLPRNIRSHEMVLPGLRIVPTGY